MKKLVKGLASMFGFEIYRKAEKSFGSATDSYQINSVNFNQRVYDYQDEAVELIKECAPYSMGSLERMFVLHHLIRFIEKNALPGDFVECGVWKGGNSALMAACHMKYSEAINRKIWMYDTYEGLPIPSDEDGIVAEHYFRNAKKKNSDQELCIADESFVNQLLDKFNFPMHNRVIVKGLFQDTLPTSKPDQIAFLRLDGDWYESTKVCMNELFDRIVPGGILMIDDYGAWEGCKRAIDEFFVAKKQIPLLHHVDFTCRYYTK